MITVIAIVFLSSGGYEVQAGIHTCAPNAATEIINAVIKNM